MAEAVTMPKMSDKMTEAILTKWLVKIGDRLKQGDRLAEVTTDKATMELENYEDGVLLFRAVENGGKIPVDGLIAIIGEAGEDISSILAKFGDAPLISNVFLHHSSPLLSSDCHIITLPSIGNGMKKACVSKWKAKVGDTIKSGDVLLELETDKASFELEAYDNGTLLYLASIKKDIAIDGLVGIIGEPLTDIQPILNHFKKVEQDQQVSELASKGGCFSFLNDLLPPYK